MLSRLALCLGATLRAVRNPAPTCSDPAPDSLTLQEMGSRLAEVRAHYRSTVELEQTIVCRNLMATRVAGLELDRCAVAKSELHGEGLFATTDLEEGELINVRGKDLQRTGNVNTNMPLHRPPPSSHRPRPSEVMRMPRPGGSGGRPFKQPNQYTYKKQPNQYTSGGQQQQYDRDRQRQHRHRHLAIGKIL